jgi:hypothetical protein
MYAIFGILVTKLRKLSGGNQRMSNPEKDVTMRQKYSPLLRRGVFFYRGITYAGMTRYCTAVSRNAASIAPLLT